MPPSCLVFLLRGGKLGHFIGHTGHLIGRMGDPDRRSSRLVEKAHDHAGQNPPGRRIDGCQRLVEKVKGTGFQKHPGQGGLSGLPSGEFSHFFCS